MEKFAEARGRGLEEEAGLPLRLRPDEVHTAGSHRAGSEGQIHREGVRDARQDRPREGRLHRVQPVPVAAQDALPRHWRRQPTRVHLLPVTLLHVHQGDNG